LKSGNEEQEAVSGSVECKPYFAYFCLERRKSKFQVDNSRIVSNKKSPQFASHKLRTFLYHFQLGGRLKNVIRSLYFNTKKSCVSLVISLVLSFAIRNRKRKQGHQYLQNNWTKAVLKDTEAYPWMGRLLLQL